jgi:hypothetical protein
MRAFLGCLLATGLFFGLMAPATLAAETISGAVKAGESTTVKESPSVLYVRAKPKDGTAEVLAPEAKGGAFKLRYTAKFGSDAKADEFTFQVGDDTTEHTAKIAITENPPAALAMGPVAYEASFKALFTLFVFAVLLESALALIFNWRPFTDNLVPRSVRPMIALAAALVFVSMFNLDITSALVNAVQGSRFGPSMEGKILTAMVIAGGSAGVNTMLVSLGFRQIKTPQTQTPKPPADKAYVSVRALKGETEGNLSVYFGQKDSSTLLGIITDRSEKNFFSWLVPDRGRLPSYGGHTVDDLTKVYELKIKDEKGAVVYSVNEFKLSGGAFIDFVFKA